MHIKKIRNNVGNYSLRKSRLEINDLYYCSCIILGILVEVNVLLMPCCNVPTLTLIVSEKYQHVPRTAIAQNKPLRVKKREITYAPILYKSDSHYLDNSQNHNLYKYFTIFWLWNMVSYIKGRIQAKGIWKQDPEANIWAQEGSEWGVKAPQRGYT